MPRKFWIARDADGAYNFSSTRMLNGGGSSFWPRPRSKFYAYVCSDEATVDVILGPNFIQPGEQVRVMLEKR